jgi:stage V sporulation protein SpoVS
MSESESKNDNVKNVVNAITDDWKVDEFTIRVRGGDENSVKKPTDPMGLALSILRVLEKNNEAYVKVNSVGVKALNITMKAFRIASNIISKRSTGVVLVMRQSEYTADLGDRTAQGICTRVFPIPTKYAI